MNQHRLTLKSTLSFVLILLMVVGVFALGGCAKKASAEDVTMIEQLRETLNNEFSSYEAVVMEGIGTTDPDALATYAEVKDAVTAINTGLADQVANLTPEQVKDTATALQEIIQLVQTASAEVPVG